MNGDHELELKRKGMHVFFGTLFVVLYAYHLITPWYILILLLLGIVWTVLFRNQDIPGLQWVLDNFERKDIPFKGMGVITMLVGIFVSFLAFERNIALAAVLVITWGDAASAVFGKLWGRHRFPWSRKTLEGTLAGIMFAFVAQLFFVPWLPALLAAVIAMLFESLDLKKLHLDDNILIPLIAGLSLFLFMVIL